MADEYHELIVEYRRQYRVVFLTEEHKRRALDAVRDNIEALGNQYSSERVGDVHLVTIATGRTTAPRQISQEIPSYSRGKPHTRASLGSRYYRDNKGHSER